jgi:hypothetical protein
VTKPEHTLYTYSYIPNHIGEANMISERSISAILISTISIGLDTPVEYDYGYVLVPLSEFISPEFEILTQHKLVPQGSSSICAEFLHYVVFAAIAVVCSPFSDDMFMSLLCKTEIFDTSLEREQGEISKLDSLMGLE